MHIRIEDGHVYLSVISDRMKWTREMEPEAARAFARALLMAADAAGQYEALVHRVHKAGEFTTLDDALASVGLFRSGAK